MKYLFFLFLIPCVSLAQSPDTPSPVGEKSAGAGGFEEPPVLRASEILQPGYLSGPHHKVREEVPTYAGANWYTIDSDYGVFQAEGNVMLQNRVAEIYAIGRLREISRGKEYAEAVKRAAKNPFVAAKNLIQNPVETVAAVPKGVFKLLSRTGRAVKDAASGRERSDYEGSEAAALLGVSKAKRDLAFQYGVNPYSTNPVLQKELNSLGWTSFAGKATVTVLTAGVGGGAETVLNVTGVLGRNAVRLRDTSPNDLRRQNKEALLGMGVSDAAAEQFLGNPAYSPSHQTNIVTSLESLAGVKGRADFVLHAATNAESETDAVFFEQTAILIARVHAESARLDRISVSEGFPVCIDQKGTLIVALHWDYAAWTSRAADFIADLQQRAATESKGTKVAVMLTGQVSPLLRQQLEARQIKAYDRVVTGPLK
jgi:hypothetical protein